ncbi:MAG: ABC transporter ATP-binding protein [Treponema sp.]|nr:ABC transporter ATP-binding protein [Treponema sp.]
MPGPGQKTKGTAKPKNAKRTISRLIKYMGAYKALFGIVLIAVLASAGATVVGDSMLRPAIDDYIIPLYERWSAGQTLSASDFIPFLKLIGIMVCVFAGGAFASWVNSRLMLYISTNTLYRIRNDLFDELEVLPLKYFDGHTHGELMSLFTNDIDTLRDMMSQSVPQLFSSIITVVSVFVMMIITSPLLTLIMIVTMIFMMMLAAVIAKKSAGAFREQQAAIGAVNGYVEEMTAGQKVVKVFNREKKSIEEFNALNDRLCEAGTRANTLANILMPIMGNMSHIQYAVVSIVGAVRVIGGHMGLGSIAAFLQYTRNFSRPITMMSQQINGILNALAGAERIFAAIDEPNEIDEGTVQLVNANETLPSASADNKIHLVQAFANTGEWAWRVPRSLKVEASGVQESFADDDAYSLVKLRGDVVFKNVSFSYVPEKEVLHSIDLHALPGQKIALVGSTGSGKTTITNLLTRFYDIEDGKGEITYDGIPIKQMAKSSLRKSLGMVLQDTHLFTGTIRDNIKYGNLEASEAQVIAAAKLANADGFISHLEKGYDTVITGDGGNLSQGQRQLLAIARAAVADPPVLILDEATSSIDTRTESLIEKGMNHLMEGRTVFVIAHRLSTVRNAHEIIVLEKGTIIERGNHEQLMQKKGRYYDLYTGKFELS